MTRLLPHESLKVYRHALQFAGEFSPSAHQWDKRHAVIDQFLRATESLLLNMAQGARLPACPKRLLFLDYAIGSALECAGCLDILQLKGMLSADTYPKGKLRLLEVTKMVYGLRKTWASGLEMKDAGMGEDEPLFHHERLTVYKTALTLTQWLMEQEFATDFSNRLFRHIDEAATSIILNIAEGNGRYSELDHHRFLEIAASSAVKVGVYLDLLGQQNILQGTEVVRAKQLSAEISAMISGM